MCIDDCTGAIKENHACCSENNDFYCVVWVSIKLHNTCFSAGNFVFYFYFFLNYLAVIMAYYISQLICYYIENVYICYRKGYFFFASTVHPICLLFGMSYKVVMNLLIATYNFSLCVTLNAMMGGVA